MALKKGSGCSRRSSKEKMKTYKHKTVDVETNK